MSNNFINCSGIKNHCKNIQFINSCCIQSTTVAFWKNSYLEGKLIFILEHNLVKLPQVYGRDAFVSVAFLEHCLIYLLVE